MKVLQFPPTPLQALLNPLSGEEMLLMAESQEPSMRAHTPSLRDRIGNGVYDLASNLGLGSTANRMRDEGTAVIDFIPGVGEVLGLNDAYNDFSAGNYGMAAAGLGLTAVGAVPGVGDAAAEGVKQVIKKNLLGHHNISEKGLAIADQMGGLPRPSLAISNVDAPLTEFGDISLITDPDMVTPSRSTNVFRADGYTARQPRAEVYAVNEKQASNAFKEKGKKYFGRHASEAQYSMSEPWNGDSSEWRHIVYAKQQGLDPDTFGSYREFREAAADVYRNADQAKYDIPAIDPYSEFGVETKQRFFKGYTPSGNRKYADYTLDNLTKHMSSNAGEENWNYGLPSFRAEVTPKFRNLKEVQSERDKVIGPEAFDAMKDGMNNEYSELLGRFAEAAGRTDFGAYEAMGQYLSDVARGRGREWADVNARVPDELKREGLDFINKVREMPTGYYEAKPKNAVGLGQFKAAIIPEKASAETRAILEKSGVKQILEYKTPEERIAFFRQFPQYTFLIPAALGAGLISQEMADQMAAQGEL
jgi:hypothetical protein